MLQQRAGEYRQLIIRDPTRRDINRKFLFGIDVTYHRPNLFTRHWCSNGPHVEFAIYILTKQTRDVAFEQHDSHLAR